MKENLVTLILLAIANQNKVIIILTVASHQIQFFPLMNREDNQLTFGRSEYLFRSSNKKKTTYIHLSVKASQYEFLVLRRSAFSRNFPATGEIRSNFHRQLLEVVKILKVFCQFNACSLNSAIIRRERLGGQTMVMRV